MEPFGVGFACGFACTDACFFDFPVVALRVVRALEVIAVARMFLVELFADFAAREEDLPTFFFATLHLFGWC